MDSYTIYTSSFSMNNTHLQRRSYFLHAKGLEIRVIIKILTKPCYPRTFDCINRYGWWGLKQRKSPMHFLSVFDLISVSRKTISVESHWCPLHQFNLLTQGPIPLNFTKLLRIDDFEKNPALLLLTYILNVSLYKIFLRKK